MLMLKRFESKFYFRFLQPEHICRGMLTSSCPAYEKRGPCHSMKRTIGSNHPSFYIYHGHSKPTCLLFFMVNNLVFRWPKLYFSWFWGLMVYIYISNLFFGHGNGRRPTRLENDSAIFPHTIHGIGNFLPIYPIKINHSWISKYTIRPMDGMG